MTDERPPRTVEFTPMLDENARHRAHLHLALVEVEQTSSRPAFGREAEWAKGVVESLKKLEREVAVHIESTERADGLYEEIAETEPRLAGRVEQLKEGHPEMLEKTRALVERLESPSSGETWTVSELRDDIQHLLGVMIKHRQKGSDLVWEAYTLDIGGIG
jgi:hypothetical protein